MYITFICICLFNHHIEKVQWMGVNYSNRYWHFETVSNHLVQILRLSCTVDRFHHVTEMHKDQVADTVSTAQHLLTFK